MTRRSEGSGGRGPSWAQPGGRWGPRLYWPMLAISLGLLVWRVVDKDPPGRIAVSALLVAVWVWLLIANRRARGE
ncbi:hypothetical protein [Streptomyces sp. VRA16 Mangrove soil]|uniref:hypothetical protein n=1 Tax=Streptomyces sp. VRA16 Mangrove soil TaxID=2817434 RepID=UPI001A9DB30A|nr:hypothetical protein [Streptomyces sp. VRA16 Mangrove soil]MBO1336437.1 hypothetical protein [Streptomyces sp. VRA16 Mangrove soil]